jgi:hypothetical protein
VVKPLRALMTVAHVDRPRVSGRANQGSGLRVGRAEAEPPDVPPCDHGNSAALKGPRGQPRIRFSPRVPKRKMPEPRVARAADAVAGRWAEGGLEPRAYGGMYDRLCIDIYPPSLQPGDRPHVSQTQRLQRSVRALAGVPAGSSSTGRTSMRGTPAPLP